MISSVGSGTVWKWSNTQSDSKPSASACAASSTVRAQASGGRPAVVFALPALRCHEPDLHPCLHIVPMAVDSCHAAVLPRHRRSSHRAGRPADAPATAPYAPAMRRPPSIPTAPLPGPPDPWASTSQPSPSIGPAVPHDRDDRGRARPSPSGSSSGTRRVGSAAAELARADPAHRARRASPVVVTGCGTSEHAAHGRRRDPARGACAPRACRPGGSARDANRSPHRRSSCRSIRRRPASSSASRTRARPTATNAALAAARAAGARTALITVTDRSPGAALADLVVETERARPELVPHGRLPQPDGRGDRRRRAPGAATDRRRPSGRGPRRCSRPGVDRAVDRRGRRRAASPSARPIVVIASGADRPAGRELVLKIEEGAWIPAAYRDLETFLHGHLAATDETTGARPDPRPIATPRRAAGAGDRGACGRPGSIGMEAAAIVTADAAVGPARPS